MTEFFVEHAFELKERKRKKFIFKYYRFVRSLLMLIVFRPVATFSLNMISQIKRPRITSDTCIQC
jgi:hypothetical protein